MNYEKECKYPLIYIIKLIFYYLDLIIIIGSKIKFIIIYYI